MLQRTELRKEADKEISGLAPLGVNLVSGLDESEICEGNQNMSPQRIPL